MLTAFQGLLRDPGRACRGTAGRAAAESAYIARGPNRATTDNPAQLTSRQLEILELLAEGT